MSDLWVPKATKQTTNGYVCLVCGEEFEAGDMSGYETHLARCSEEYSEDIEAHFKPKREFNEPLDPEWAAYNNALKNAGVDPEVQYARGRRSNIRRARES